MVKKHFQQGGTSFHTCNINRIWFEERKINLLNDQQTQQTETYFRTSREFYRIVCMQMADSFLQLQNSQKAFSKNGTFLTRNTQTKLVENNEW